MFSIHSAHFCDQVCGFLHWTRSIPQLFSVLALSGVGVVHHEIGGSVAQVCTSSSDYSYKSQVSTASDYKLNVSPYDFLSELNPLIGQWGST